MSGFDGKCCCVQCQLSSTKDADFLTHAAGWVAYSNQSRLGAEDEAPYLEKHAAQAKFHEFLRTFQTETEGQQSSEVYKYRCAQ